MGGRGTYAIGNKVPYTYETIAKNCGIKVLKGMNGKHGLPEESHTSSKYLCINKDGSVRQIRIYDKNHRALVDIEYSNHQGKLFLHAHDYVNGDRKKARELSPAEKKKFIKFFGGEL